MREYPSDIAFTPAVKAIQQQKGSRGSYARQERSGGWETTVTPELAEFLAELDMFYLGTATADGQPYIQHRGGPPGFLKVVDDHTLGFADFGGNRQYLTLGNLSENPKAFIFLMDYANSQRVKLWGTARAIEGDAAAGGEAPRPGLSGHGGAGDPVRGGGVGRELPATHPPAVLAEANRPRDRETSIADYRTRSRSGTPAIDFATDQQTVTSPI